MRRILRVLTALAVAAIGLILVAGPAFADGHVPSGDVSPDAPVGDLFTINNTLVTLLVGVIVPWVVSFLTSSANPAAIKLAILGVVSEAANLLQNAIQDDGTAIISQEHLLQFAVIVATAILTYLGVYNPALRARGGLNAATGPGLIQVPSKTPG